MLLRKLTSTTPASPVPSPPTTTRHFADLDAASLSSFSSVPSPSMSSAPTSPQSKTHAFFASPFSTRPPSPMLPPKKTVTAAAVAESDSNKPTPPRSLTADFFSKSSSSSSPPLPPKPSSPLVSVIPPPKSSRRNFLNLGLNDDNFLSSPVTLAGTFASTPTPTEPKEDIYKEFGKDDRSNNAIGANANGWKYDTSNYDSSWMDATNEPTPRPPSRTLNISHLPQPPQPPQQQPTSSPPSTSVQPQLGDSFRNSPPSITEMGTEPDAEVLSTSPSSFSHLSANMPNMGTNLGTGLGMGISGYPSRPTSALSYRSNASSQDAGTGAVNIMQFVPSIGEQEYQMSQLYPTTDEVELAPGMIIRSFLPRSMHGHGVGGGGTGVENDQLSPTPYGMGMQSPQSISAASSSSSYTSGVSVSSTSVPVPVTLRLSRALGQGTFSSVWLAEDLSPEALLVRSRKSLRSLKRASTRDLKKGRERGGDRDRDREREKEKERSGSSILSISNGHAHTQVDTVDGKLKPSLSTTSSLMRRLRGGVSGTRPGGASASAIKPKEQKDRDGETGFGFGTFGVVMGRRGTIMPLPPPLPVPLSPTPTSSLPSPNPPALPTTPTGLPPSLIPGHPSSSTSPKMASDQSLGIGVPNTMGPGVSPSVSGKGQAQGGVGLGLGLPNSNGPFNGRNRVLSGSSGMSVYLEFKEGEGDGGTGKSPPVTLEGALAPMPAPVPVPSGITSDTGTGAGASLSRASSISWKSCVSVSSRDSSDEGHGNGNDVGVERKGSVRSVNSKSSLSGNGNGKSDVESVSASASASASRSSSTRSSRGVGKDKDRTGKPTTTRLVAVKLTSRGVIEERERKKGGEGVPLSPREKEEEKERARERDRTRVSFVREVEVMKHISHPNITPLLSHLTTRTHHVLVLPYLPGGDLLGLVNDDQVWNSLGESTLCRIFAELCKAVGWMHGVGLVHRDIKLENILLTVPLGLPSSDSQPNSGSTVGHNGMVLGDGLTSASPTSYVFPASATSLPASPSSASYDSTSMPMPPPPPTDTLPSPLPPPPHPLIKLTDFGLSRFIDPANPLLTTRCGSEAYAAPELVMGGGRAGVASSTKSPWFEDTEGGGYANEHGRHDDGDGAGGYDARETDAWAVGVVLYVLVGRRLPFGEGPGEALIGKIGGEGVNGSRGFSAMERRQWLMKIARGEWSWPEPSDNSDSADAVMIDSSEALRGPTLVHSVGAKRAVERLLVRDPSRRARVKDLWEDEWLSASGVRGGGTGTWANTSVNASSDIYAHAGEYSRAGTVEGLPSGTDAYSAYAVKINDDSGLPTELPFSSSRSPSGLPSELPLSSASLGLGSVFGAGYSVAASDQGVQEGEEEEFDNDRREKEDGEVPGSRQDRSSEEREDEEEDEEDEEDDGEGWLVDKDGINHIARSEVPR